MLLTLTILGPLARRNSGISRAVNAINGTVTPMKLFKKEDFAPKAKQHPGEGITYLYGSETPRVRAALETLTRMMHLLEAHVDG